MSPRPLFGGKHVKPLPWYPMPYMEDFLRVIDERGSSESHKSSIYLALAHFGIFAHREGLRHPEEIERKHILHFQTYLKQDAMGQLSGKNISEAYQRTLQRGVRSWIYWLVERRLITESPWVNIKVGWTPKTSKPVSHDDLVAVFETHRRQAFHVSPFYFHRREAILTLLYGWGLNLGEMLALNVPNMDMRQDFVLIRSTDGKRSRPMPYGPEMKGVVGRWLSLRSTKASPTEDALFIDNRGERMTGNNARKILGDLGERAGVALLPSRLRDTFGYNLLDRGVSTDIVMGLLGLTRKVNVLAFDPKAQKVKQAHEELIATELTDLLGHYRPPGDPS